MRWKKGFVTFLFAVVLAFSITNAAWAQTMEIAKTYSFGGSGTDEVGSLQRTSDGGYIECGFTNSTDGDFPVSGTDEKEDGVVIKYKSDFSIEWTKVLGGTSSDRLNQVRQTSDGGYIVSGFSNSTDGIFATIPIFGDSPKTINKGSMDGVLIKLKSDGSVEWVNTVGGSGYDDIASVEQTSDGGYVAVGDASSKDQDMQGFPADSMYFNTFLAKFSADGTKQWVKTAGMGELNSVKEISGGYITCGFLDSPYFANNTSYQHPQSCAVCWNSDGSVRWKKVFSGSGEDTGFMSVCQTSDGGFAAAGASCSNDQDYQGLNKGQEDVFLAKFQSDGSVEWKRDIGGSLNEQATEIQQTKDGGYVVVGFSGSSDKDFVGLNNSSQSEGFVLKLKSDGSTDWLKDYNVNKATSFNSMLPTTDGGYLIGGVSSDNSDVSQGNIDSVIVKINNFQTVTFETNGATSIDPVKQIENTTTTSFPTTTKAGYTLEGWYTDPSFTQTSKVSFPYTFDASRKVYAKWVNHSVTYDYEHDSITTSEKTATGSLLTEPAVPTRDGYQFAGWYQDGACTNKWNFSSDKVGDSDFTLYAKWTGNQYKTTWRYLGFTDSYTHSTGELLNQTETYPAEEGYTFEGWYYDQAYTNRVTYPLYMPAKDLDIYGKYTPNQYKTTWRYLGFTDSYTHSTGELLNQTETYPAEEGHTFGGWYYDQAYTNRVTYPLYMPAKDLDVYGKYTPNQYTVSFNANGGSVVNNVTQSYGSNITTAPETTQTGYTFGGWYSDSALTTAVTFPYTIPAKDTTLYAKWTAVTPDKTTYTVTYDSQGGSTVAGTHADSGSLLTAPAAPIRDGYVFYGWYKDSACTDSSKWNFATDKVASDLTLYADWLLMGDVNFDGCVDSYDVALVLKYYNNQKDFTDKQRFVADMNSDGAIDSYDVAKIKKIYAGKNQ